MSKYRVIFKRVVSADGRAIAEARSEVFTAGDASSTVAQSMTIHISSSSNSRTSNHGSSSSSYSASS
ncbi:hypothetical protein [Leptodesmis sichuanensis]|jgi:hypothetical protein|uniref:hypothetical protein n=1 Tax=Leptodesmis sichuanensis TaxID=2906798 RepID=UPI001F1E0972|nr:hypothetical protein [Leptodesmis sichuanensis]UIE38730.1 hypothetical protein KIK02_03645 [Leptodesmis sichuanensis A121]